MFYLEVKGTIASQQSSRKRHIADLWHSKSNTRQLAKLTKAERCFGSQLARPITFHFLIKLMTQKFKQTHNATVNMC